MEPNTFIDLVFCLSGVVLAGNHPIHPDALAPCRPHYGAAVDQI